MITISDGRKELFQWDTGREVKSSEPVTQFHFSNKAYGRTLDVDAVENAAKIPDVLLQSAADLHVYAFVGSDLDGFTRVEAVFRVNRRNKPADYVFTPTEQISYKDLQNQIGDLKNLQTVAKGNLVEAVNEAAKSGGGTGGTSNYNLLDNKPKINGVELKGNQTAADLGIIDDTAPSPSKVYSSEKASQLLAEKADKTYVDEVLGNISTLVGGGF